MTKASKIYVVIERDADNRDVLLKAFSSLDEANNYAEERNKINDQCYTLVEAMELL